MNIYDPIAIALGTPSIVHLTDYPTLEELLEAHPPTNHHISPSNKGSPISEGQTFSMEERLNNGTHNFLDSEFQRKYNRLRTEAGKHNFQSEIVRKKVIERNKVRVRKEINKGVHPFQNQKQVVCPHCNKTGANSVMHRFHFDKCKFIG
jgi:hypothetical protein